MPSVLRVDCLSLVSTRDSDVGQAVQGSVLIAMDRYGPWTFVCSQLSHFDHGIKQESRVLADETQVVLSDASYGGDSSGA
jgi:hypothetical protein